ncbi:MAG: BlaI/MecI/CopY family transcriptional regulator [Bacteroides sp.]|nr:BlaI/MecI/CopY family transcriptional regulator [Bacteroides sp.]
MKHLTAREEVLMNMFWDNGPMHVRDVLKLFPEPKPHFNTVSTFVRILENKDFLDHETVGNSHRYFAKVSRDDFKRGTLRDVITRYFDNSLKGMMSALVADENLSDDEIRDLIQVVQSASKEKEKKG